VKFPVIKFDNCGANIKIITPKNKKLTTNPFKTVEDIRNAFDFEVSNNRLKIGIKAAVNEPVTIN